jgi:CDGSH-type Zn-finger protein
MDEHRKITVAKNGPYRVRGPLTITDPTGRDIDIAEGENAALCRCGASQTKPFCDGTHSKVGFAAAEAAVQAEES